MAAVEPVGYPDTAAICGRDEGQHPEPGLVILRESEHEEYKHGRRVFTPYSHSVHIRVKDPVVRRL